MDTKRRDQILKAVVNARKEGSMRDVPWSEFSLSERFTLVCGIATWQQHVCKPGQCGKTNTGLNGFSYYYPHVYKRNEYRLNRYGKPTFKGTENIPTMLRG